MRAAVILAILLASGAARAGSERYAVIIGNDTGAGDEQKLRFAETDATHVGELLGEIGGIPDENQVVLRGKDADQVRRALIATNERIRIDQHGGTEAVLFVYYSGHGDADALHLGSSRLLLRELEALVRGSSAQVRILVIDSCRSGSVTRVKGGAPAPPIALSSSLDENPGEGVIILTASTAGEDAQESDQLSGSFFTHYLLSGLRGAADDDANQIVTVEEAFRYTREQTILASSRTLGGTQHPTFHYDLRGRSEIILADLGSARGRGRLTVPDGATWLVMRGSPTGPVVGEIVGGARRRTLSLSSGIYWVRGRTTEALLDGAVSVAIDRETAVDPGSLERTTYARLVRKGRGEILHHVSGPVAGLLFETPIIAGASTCMGGFAGWVSAHADLTLSPRVAACRGSFSNATLSATTDLVTLEVRASRAWDLSRVTLDLGITAGFELLQERFVTRGIAPTRTTPAGHVDAGLGASLALGGRVHLDAEVAAQTHFLSIEDQGGSKAPVARFAVRGLLGVGVWF